MNVKQESVPIIASVFTTLLFFTARKLCFSGTGLHTEGQNESFIEGHSLERQFCKYKGE